jgi:hypothetical protein
MATVTKGKTFASGEVVTPNKMHEMVDNASVSAIVNADIDASAAIAASKLAATLDFSTKTITLPLTSVTDAMLAASLNLSGKTLTMPAALSLSYPTLAGPRGAIVNLGAVSGTQTFNLQSGNIFQVKPNGAITVSPSNVPASGTFIGMLIRHEGDGTARTYTWPATTKWAFGEAPTMTSTNAKFDLVSLFTYDGGTTWFGQIVGQNY